MFAFVELLARERCGGSRVQARHDARSSGGAREVRVTALAPHVTPKKRANEVLGTVSALIPRILNRRLCISLR